MEAFIGFLAILFFIFIFFLPTIIAVNRDCDNKVAIIVINIVLGLLWGIGWVVALIWALVGDKRVEKVVVNSHSSVDELEKLHKLKLEGAITEQEFNNKKAQLLK
ncbi:hypothetical protein THMIRHAS_23550 [Thiosulfatimonas sediminis]|uniref:SHOCT domain-containing protein n=1 Tax=Thiosulfatimonas sediminis TaxID=2675054 RepID=A0A6F8PXV3_9GAMM|nr:superinfection immunity protein [Thiosulfatimonas sediminis]BBP46982.1 hypothetical protein THMIRHAS_23550 [Thiosulfatimonas sediminis]